MKFPRPRLKIKGIVVLILIIAVAGVIARSLLDRWRQQGYRSPASGSSLSVKLDNHSEPFPSGIPVQATISYDFRFKAGIAPPETEVVLLGSIWLEETKTGQYVDGYTFDVTLIGGKRERATEKFIWETKAPRPGHYLLRYWLSDVTYSSKGHFISGGGKGYKFTETERNPLSSGAKP